MERKIAVEMLLRILEKFDGIGLGGGHVGDDRLEDSLVQEFDSSQECLGCKKQQQGHICREDQLH